MKEINLTVSYGDTTRNVRLMAPSGAGNGYHVYIDKYYNGTIIKRNGEWTGLMGPKSELQTADILELGEIIDRHNQE